MEHPAGPEMRKRIEENMRRLNMPKGGDSLLGLNPEQRQTLLTEESERTVLDPLRSLINAGVISKEKARALLLAWAPDAPVDVTPTDTDTPRPLFTLLQGLLAHHQGNLITELGRSAMKLRIQGQIEALEWVMQQITDIIDANRADDEKWGRPFGGEPLECDTCHGQGWVVEGQSMGFPSGEQVQCPSCGGDGDFHQEFPDPSGMPHEHGLVPPQEGDTIQRDGQLYVRRGFVWEQVPFQHGITSVKRLNGVAYVKVNGHWVEATVQQAVENPVLNALRWPQGD